MKFTHIDKLFNSRDEILNEYKFDAVLFFNDHIKIPSYYQKINLIFSLDDKISVKDASRLISNFDLLVRVGYYPDLFGFVGEKMSLYIKYIEELYAENIKRFAYNIKSFDRLVILESDKDNLIIKQILGQLQNVKEVFLCKIETKNQSLLISQQPIGYILSKNPKIDCLYLGSNNDLPLVICEHGKYYRFISAISNIMQGISIVPCVIDIINILDKSIKIEQNLSRYTDIKCQNIASFKAFLKSAKFSNDIILIIDKIKQFLTKFSEIPFKYKDFIAEINQLFNFDINTDLNIGIKSIQDLKDIALLEYKMTQNNNLYSYINDINNVHDNIVIHITDNLIAKYNIGNPNAKKQMKHDIGCAINSSKNAIICLDLKDSINSIIARKELCDILQKATKCSDEYPKKQNYETKEIDNFDRKINSTLYFKDIKMLMNNQIDFAIFHSCKLRKIRDFFDYDYNRDFGNIVHKLAVNPEIIPFSDDKYFKILLEPKLKKISDFLIKYNKEMVDNGFEILNEKELSDIWCKISISNREFIIIAKPDRIDISKHGGILSDYKTSLATSFTDEKSLKSPQLLCYSMIIANSDKQYNISEVRYIYLNKNGKCDVKSRELSLIGNSQEFEKNVIDCVNEYLLSEKILTESDDVDINHIMRVVN